MARLSELPAAVPSRGGQAEPIVSAPTGSGALRSPVPLRLRRAREFIFDHVGEPLPLVELAHRAELSPYHFLRTFHAAFGETPGACVTRARLELAKELLVGSELPVTEICLQVGFESLGSFSTLFARRVGTPPSRYRARLKRLVQVPEQLVSPAVPFCFLERYAAVA